MKDIYTSLSGGFAAWRQVEQTSNNIANANTSGFREARAAYRTDGQLSFLDAISYNPSDGALMVDNNPEHFALRGDGFFALADGSYTRDGHFHIDLQGNLLTAEGIAVLDDQNNPIIVNPADRLSVAPNGAITGSISGRGPTIGRFQLNNPQPAGGNRWGGTPTPVQAEVIQGALEQSNADPLRSMVELIEASRYLESQEKLIQTSDEMRARLNRLVA